MNAPFSSRAEAAATAWGVPALAAGYSVGNGPPVTAAVGCELTTVFRIASITKPVTATLALELLDLEAATGVWAGDVRVRHLLSHTSGYDCECGDLTRFGTGDDALAGVVAELPGVRRLVEVEQAWSYANTGFWLAAHLAAEQAGCTYEEALFDRVLGPAGLEATSFGEPELAGTGAEASPGPYPRARRASGGLVSNVPDLLRFGRRHLADPGSARLRVPIGKPTSGVYGLGLGGERVGGIEVWGHGGSYGGFQSSFRVVPDRDAVFAGVTNSSLGGKALDELEDAFFETVIGTGRKQPDRVDLPAETLASFVGTYVNDDGRYEVRQADGGLFLTVDGSDQPAQAIGPRTFEITEGDAIHERFDFPLDGFGRFESRLAEHVAS
jgi:CubicO group peptidase (beta-lactamase class C family)